jgi:AcrR family transcriptional regulator
VLERVSHAGTMATRSPRRRLPRAERERQTLAAALSVFTARGFEAASMDEIAMRAGVTKPMLYRHFDSKEGLYLACIESAGRPAIETFRAAVASETAPDRRLWAGARAFFGWVEDNREVYARLFLEATARGGAPGALVTELRRDMGRTLADLFTASARAAGVGVMAEVEAQAVCLYGATEALARWWLDHPDVSRDLVALRLVNFAWRGIEDSMRGNLWLPPPDSR